ncbi:MAG TPA: hypothetical protein PKN36_08155 [bacterium]|nr:hypothetical protein [bacterium]
MKKTCFLGILVLFLASGLAFAETELEKELNKLREAGIPTTIEELNLPEIPDEENGALVYREVFKLVDSLKEKYKDEWKYIPYEGTVKWEDVPEAEKKKVADLILRNSDFAKIYGLLEKASGMKCMFLSKEDWKKGFSLPLPHLAKLRSCTRLLSARAAVEMENKNIDRSLSACLTGLKISGSISGEPLLISQLVRIAINAIAIHTAKEMVGKGEGSPEIYKSLIEGMKYEREKSPILYGLTGELAMARQEISNSRKEIATYLINMEGSLKTSYEKNPEAFWNEQESAYVKTMGKLINLVRVPFYEVKDKFEESEKELMALPKEKGIVAQLLIPGASRALLQEARIDALLGAAEMGIANRIYKQEHGEFVEFLSQLTPDILPTLPLDPFTGKDYIYKKKDKGFIVYSVGEDEKDDGGVMEYFTLKPDIVWEDKGLQVKQSVN